MKKIYHWVSEEKKHVRFGTWDAKEVSLLLIEKGLGMVKTTV